METPIETPTEISTEVPAKASAVTPQKEILMIAAVVLIIGLAVGGYFWWDNWKNSISSGIQTLENIGGTADKITESAIQGVLPSIGTNPLESKPDVNPADKANPFKNIITNPFQ